jgi:lipopolysaccharide/colanic/teichoic acid biosynthesis glycosyltransferase
LLAGVVSGKRSLVGPSRAVNGERLKPGITATWLTVADVSGRTRRDRLDIYYLQNWSLTADVEIMILTLKQLPSLFQASAADVTSKEGGQ